MRPRRVVRHDGSGAKGDSRLACGAPWPFGSGAFCQDARDGDTTSYTFPAPLRRPSPFPGGKSRRSPLRLIVSSSAAVLVFSSGAARTRIIPPRFSRSNASVRPGWKEGVPT